MVKSIIKRIIVGVGVALALMFIKGNLLMDVQAMSVYRAIPDSMYQVDYNGTQTDMGMTTLSVNGLNTTLYGRKFSANAQRFYYYWNFDGEWSMDITHPVDINFIFYSGLATTSEKPYRVFIVDHNHNTYSCNVNAGYRTTSATTQYLNGGYLHDVKCSNVGLSYQTFKVYLADDYYTNSQTLGISALTVYPSSDSSAVVGAVNSNTSAVNGVNDTLNDDSIDEENTASTISNLDSQLSDDSQISDLITMPIAFFQKLVTSASNNVCSQVSLGTLFGTRLNMPCISLQSVLGSSLYNTIDVLLCGIFCFAIRKKVVDIFNNITSLKDRGNEFE